MSGAWQTKRWHRRCVLAVVVLFAVATVPWQPVTAQRRIDRSSSIEVHHRAGKILSGARKDESVLTDVNRFEVRKGSKVAVVVADQNPLLFTYDANVTEAETEQHKIAAQFATTLGAVLKPFQSRLGGGLGGTAIEVEGLNFKQFTADLDSLNSYLSQVRAKIALSLGAEADVSVLKQTVSGWGIPTLAGRIRQGYERLVVVASKCLSRQSLGATTGVGISCTAPLDRARASVGQTAEELVVDATDPTPVRTTPPPRPGDAKPAPPANGSAPSTSNRAPAPAPRTDAPHAQTIESFVTLALAMQTRVDQAVQVLRGFSTDVAAINTPKMVADRTYGLNNQTVELAVKPSSKYDDFLDAATKTKRDAAARKVSIVLEPYTPVALGLAPAAVLLFIKNPTYSATTAGSGFTISEVDEDATLYNLAAMLTITPRAWDQSTFGGSFELGLSPTKDKIGLFAGAGITVQDLFIVGGGFAWQQVNRLGKGLTVGQTIATTEALKTDAKFRPGFYLHITVK